MSGSSENSQHEKRDSAPNVVTHIPGYELLRPIARGSYGEVWLARDSIACYRAIKIVHRATFSDDRPFRREFEGMQRFEPLSREHQGLVDILHVGRDPMSNTFYYVMELADD